MTSLVKSRDKRTGVTYVYESESYWDSEKKQPRSRRKLIGKVDEETGAIVPTRGRRGRAGKAGAGAADAAAGAIEEREAGILALRLRVADRGRELGSYEKRVEAALRALNG